MEEEQPKFEFPVPSEIPGELITDEDELFHLKEHLAKLCNLDNLQYAPSLRLIHSLSLLVS